MSVQIRGFSNVIAEVNAERELNVALTRTADNVGFAAVACEVSDGDQAPRRVIPVDASRDFRMRTALDSVFFNDVFVGATLNASKWQAPVTTQTVTVSGGVATLNASSITTVSTVSRIVSYKTVPITASFPIYSEQRAGYFGASLGIPNCTAEWGFGNVTGTTILPIDAARFVWTTTGAFLASVTYNSGTELTVNITAAATAAGVAVNEFQNYLIVMDVGEIVFYINNIEVASIAIPLAGAFAFSSVALPTYARVTNSGVAPASAVQVRVASATISQGDMNNARAWGEQMSMGGDGSISQPTGTAAAQTANYANSAAPAAATLSNTAAGYTTLGGQYLFTTVGTAETDYALFGFQVPALAALGRAASLAIRQVRISAFNVGAAVATTATMLFWGLGLGSTAVSLATADAATTRAPRRLTIGGHTWAIGAAIGASGGPDVVLDTAKTPLLVEAGTFFHVICKLSLSTATASQQIRGTVAVIGNWE